MAHFAELDENNVVLRVLVVPNDQEENGQTYLADYLGLGGRWLQTSYNNSMRKQFAGIGYTYNAQHDVFVKPQPFASWSLNATLDWVAPIEMPVGANVIWDEDNQRWLGDSMLPQQFKTQISILGG